MDTYVLTYFTCGPFRCWLPQWYSTKDGFSGFWLWFGYDFQKSDKYFEQKREDLKKAAERSEANGVAPQETAPIE